MLCINYQSKRDTVVKKAIFAKLTKDESEVLYRKVTDGLKNYMDSNLESTVFDICDSVPLYCISIYQPMPAGLIKRIFKPLTEVEAYWLFRVITKNTLTQVMFDKITDIIKTTYGEFIFMTINNTDLYMVNDCLSVAIKDREYLSRFVIERDFLPNHHHELLRYSDKDGAVINLLD